MKVRNSEIACICVVCVHECLYLTLLTCLLFNKLALLLSILDFAALVDSWRSRLCSPTHSRHYISHFSSCRFIFYGQYPFGACGCFLVRFLEIALAVAELVGWKFVPATWRDFNSAGCDFGIAMCTKVEIANIEIEIRRGELPDSRDK